MQRGFSSTLFLVGLLLVVLTAVVIKLLFFSSSSQTENLPSINKFESTMSAILLADQQSSSSADQKYSNNELGFEMMLPINYQVRNDTELDFYKRTVGANIKNVDLRKNFTENIGYSPGEVLGIVAILEKADDFENAPLQIWVFDNSNNLSIDQWYQNYWYYPFVWGDISKEGRGKVAPVDDLSLPGLGAKSAVIDYQPGKPRFVYISKDDKIFMFRVLRSGEQSLSSLKLH